MSDLTSFRDHARRMVTADHKPDCTGLVEDRWGSNRVHPDPDCPGCVTPADRRLWAQLAAETDAYLQRNNDTALELA